jgi:hypothetical protein
MLILAQMLFYVAVVVKPLLHIFFFALCGSVHMTQDTCGKQVLPTSPSACT